MFDKEWKQLMNARTRAKRHEIEMEQGWVEEAETMPLLRFPKEWQVQIIPAFSDAVVRFRVTLPSGLTKSVFLDSRDSINSLNEHFCRNGNPVPYWEVSPVGSKLGRCKKYDIATLLGLIAFEDE